MGMAGSWNRMEAARAWDPHRSVLAVGAIGVPVMEAMHSIGMDPQGIIQAEVEATGLACQLRSGWPMENLDELVEWLLDTPAGETPTFDWLLAVYSGEHQPVGKPDGALEHWY